MEFFQGILRLGSPAGYARQREKHTGCPEKGGKGKGREETRLKIDENRMCHQTEADGWRPQGIVQPGPLFFV